MLTPWSIFWEKAPQHHTYRLELTSFPLWVIALDAYSLWSTGDATLFFVLLRFYNQSTLIPIHDPLRRFPIVCSHHPIHDHSRGKYLELDVLQLRAKGGTKDNITEAGKLKSFCCCGTVRMPWRSPNALAKTKKTKTKTKPEKQTKCRTKTRTKNKDKNRPRPSQRPCALSKPKANRMWTVFSSVYNKYLMALYLSRPPQKLGFRTLSLPQKWCTRWDDRITALKPSTHLWTSCTIVKMPVHRYDST